MWSCIVDEISLTQTLINALNNAVLVKNTYTKKTQQNMITRLEKLTLCTPVTPYFRAHGHIIQVLMFIANLRELSNSRKISTNVSSSNPENFLSFFLFLYP